MKTAALPNNPGSIAGFVDEIRGRAATALVAPELLPEVKATVTAAATIAAKATLQSLRAPTNDGKSPYNDAGVARGDHLEHFVHTAHSFFFRNRDAQEHSVCRDAARLSELGQAALTAAVRAALPGLEVLRVELHYDSGMPRHFSDGVASWTTPESAPLASVIVDVRDPIYAAQRSSATGVPITEAVEKPKPARRGWFSWFGRST